MSLKLPVPPVLPPTLPTLPKLCSADLKLEIK